MRTKVTISPEVARHAGGLTERPVSVRYNGTEYSTRVVFARGAKGLPYTVLSPGLPPVFTPAEFEADPCVQAVNAAFARLGPRKLEAML